MIKRNIKYYHLLRYNEIFTFLDEEIKSSFSDILYCINDNRLFIKLIDLTTKSVKEDMISFDSENKRTNLILKDFLVDYFSNQEYFFGTPLFIYSDVFSHQQFDELYQAAIKLKEEKNQLEIQLNSESKIIKYCKSVQLNPRPAGGNPNNWEASCPSGANHSIMISAEFNSWGCGYCKKKGYINLLKEWYESKHEGNNVVIDLNYTKQRVEWKKRFETLNDLELVETFNGQIGIRAWGYGRAAYISCLENEFRNRKFDCTILFGEDRHGYGLSFRLGHRVQLIKGKLYRDVDLQNPNAKAEINKHSKDMHQEMLSKLVNVGYENLSESEKAYWNSVY